VTKRSLRALQSAILELYKIHTHWNLCSKASVSFPRGVVGV